MSVSSLKSKGSHCRCSRARIGERVILGEVEATSSLDLTVVSVSSSRLRGTTSGSPAGMALEVDTPTIFLGLPRTTP